MTRSPYHITYEDLIKEHSGRLAYLERTLEQRKLQGANAHNARKQIEALRLTVALFKKFKKDPTINLFDVFQNIKQ